MKKFAVLGRPIAHSKSPQIHQCFAEDAGVQLSYERLLVPEDVGFSTVITQFQGEGGYGANVTAPCKEDAFKWVTKQTERAQLAGAVNNIIFNVDGSSLGDNLDGAGLIKDMKDFYGWILQNKRVLILGAGGAVRGILYPLLLEKPALVTIANRSVGKAQMLAESFESFGMVTFSDLKHCATAKWDVLINSIPMKETVPDLPPLSADTLCYDLNYADQRTPFLQAVSVLGVSRMADGLGMLIEERAEAFFLWHGIRPDTLKARALLRPLWEDKNGE